MNELEQRRRDLKHADPTLYAYIAAKEAAKVLDDMGGILSGMLNGHAVANKVWAAATRYKSMARRMNEEQPIQES